ncbi:MAG TPA: FMN-binding protein [Trebonia sp.]|nr:FMN-binding protein [Trebonia sp.]
MRRAVLAICATAVALVLLLSFKTHTQSAAPGASPAAALGSPTPGGATGSTGTPSTGTPSTGTPGTGTGAAKTVTGAAWPTIYGPVQVRVTVTAGKLTAVSAVEYPTETPRDYQINAFAIPQLNAEAMAAGSAKIDTVSGATYTSGGYVGSLQNALDKAGL